MSGRLTNGWNELEKCTSQVVWNQNDISLKKYCRYGWVVSLLRKIYLTPNAAELNQLLSVTCNSGLSVESNLQKRLPFHPIATRISSPFPSTTLVNFPSGRGQRGASVPAAKAEVKATMEMPTRVPLEKKEKNPKTS